MTIAFIPITPSPVPKPFLGPDVANKRMGPGVCDKTIDWEEYFKPSTETDIFTVLQALQPKQEVPKPDPQPDLQALFAALGCKQKVIQPVKQEIKPANDNENLQQLLAALVAKSKEVPTTGASSSSTTGASSSSNTAVKRATEGQTEQLREMLRRKLMEN